MQRLISQDRKDEILSAIKNDLTVAEASTQFSVSTKAIYAWLRGQVDNTGTSALEVARLRREVQELKEIIDYLTLEKSRGGKIAAGRRRMDSAKSKAAWLARWVLPAPRSTDDLWDTSPARYTRGC